MIKWLMDIISSQEDEKKPYTVDNTKDRENRRPKAWLKREGILYFLDKLKAFLLEIMVSIEKDDPRYLKLSNWLELMDMVKDSMEHHGLKVKIRRNLGLEVKEESDENNNQQSEM